MFRDLGRGIAVFERAPGIIYLSVPKTTDFATATGQYRSLDGFRSVGVKKSWAASAMLIERGPIAIPNEWRRLPCYLTSWLQKAA